VGDHRDQPVSLDLPQSLPDHRSAHLEALAQITFDQPITWRELA
jgi:hypothetical protein